MVDPMNPTRLLLPLSVAIFGIACFANQTQPKVPKPNVVSFGRDIRPILSQHCYKCHGPDVETAAAGLRLDSFAGYTKHLDDGAAVVPGNPAASKMIERVSEFDVNMRMPPPGAGVSALTPDQIGLLKEWIAEGATYEKHWAFIAPVMPQLPTVDDPRFAKNPIDRFVYAKLREEGLKPEPEADKGTLALRAAQTLTGLAPTPAELDRFLSDKKPGAYERYVDRMLAKPEYGEHEARYWLDAVRYADTHGLQLDNERGIYPYRDWVVSAFNKDLPYNEFVKWQLAGDLLPNPTTEQLVATGYVRANLTSNEGGAIPEEFLARNTFDRVDSTATVLLGLTVGCAKCHDHKFDPIKQADYYGLYAYFDSTRDEPLDGNIEFPPPVIRASTPAQESQLAKMDSQLRAWTEAVDPATALAWFDGNHHAPPTSRDWQISPVYPADSFDKAFDNPEPGEPGQPAATWKPLNFELGKDFLNLIGRDNASVYVKGTVTVDRSQTVTLNVASDDGIRIWLNGKLIHSHKVNRGLTEGSDMVKAEFRAGDNTLIAKLVNGTSSDGLDIHVGGPNDERIVRSTTFYRKSPQNIVAQRELRETFLAAGPDSKTALAYRAMLDRRAKFEAAIPMTLIAREMALPRPTFILKRGQYDQKGERVTRHIPPALGTLPPGVPNNRLGLATWMVEPSNPLVARVFVNRIWQQHFGVGIVKTAEDFGSQGEWPVNQKLLDYLAVTFIRSGWSVKKLNRLIVTSEAFRQSSRISAAKLAKDPENRLISRGPRFRLDAEVIRDKALEDAGLLVEKLGGHGFKPYQPSGLWEGSSDPASGTHFYVRDKDLSIYRRSLYMFWKRTSPPPVMVTFDAPLRDTCVVRRSITDTPLQALALLNETAFLEASRATAARVLNTSGSDAVHMRKLYGLMLARPPRATESTLLERALTRYRRIYEADPAAAKRLLKVGDAPQSKAIPAPEQAAWMIVCSSVMNTDEFMTQH